jgi:predicted DNA-binding ribbon-helix-helix protein
VRGPARHRISVGGRQTRIRLGSAMWEALQDIAHQTGSSIDALVTEIDRRRHQQTLEAAIHDYVVAYYRAIMQAALHSAARQRCATTSEGKSAPTIAVPLSDTTKAIPTCWRGLPLHGLYSFASKVASLFVSILPATMRDGEIVPTDRRADPAVGFASPSAT